MFQSVQTHIAYWVAIGLLILTLAISSLSLAFDSGATDAFPLFETSSTQVDPDAILVCSGGGSNNESGIC